MILSITIFIFILVINSMFSLPSDEVWNKTMQFLKEKKMLDFNKTHFIFDEYNYTKLDINDNKMKSLYEKQNYIYNNFNMTTFIFLVKYINETQEILDPTFRRNMRENLKKFGISENYTLFTVISVDTKKALIYTGSKTRKNYISDEEARLIKNTLLTNINNANYYNTLNVLFDDITNFSEEKVSIDTTFTRTIPWVDHHSNGDNKILTVLLGTILPIVIVFGLVLSIFCCCKKGWCDFKHSNTTNDVNTSYNYGAGGCYDDRNDCGGNSIGGNSVGGNSVGGNSVGGNSVGGNSVGGNSGCSGGA